jgi:precorrin-3B synthase
MLSARHLRRVSEATSAFGSALEITSRANLQIRGVRTGSHDRLVRDLVAAGVTRADAAADARRNVLASPTAGIDPREVADTRPLIAAVVDVLVRAAGAGLSPKFGVLVDGGGAVHVRGRRQDICLGAVRLTDGSWGYEVRLGRQLPELPDAEPVSVVSPAAAAGLVSGALDLMAEHPEAGGRMSVLVDLLGVDRVLSLAAARRGIQLCEMAPSELVPGATTSLRPIGALLQCRPDYAMVGAMPVLGRLTGQQLGAIASVAEEFCDRGAAEVRLTPWRSVVVPNVSRQRAASALQALEEIGLVVDPTDPALSVVACAGSTGCPLAFTDTQRDARAMVEALRTARPARRFTVHLSGCSKRCADSTTEFDVTLVGGPVQGSYEVVMHPDRCESDAKMRRSDDVQAALARVLSATGSETT